MADLFTLTRGKVMYRTFLQLPCRTARPWSRPYWGSRSKKPALVLDPRSFIFFNSNARAHQTTEIVCVRHEGQGDYTE